MKLTKEEKQALSILDGVIIKDAESHIKKFIDFPADEIKKVINKLISLKLIDMIRLPNDGQQRYFHNTRNIGADDLNDDLRFRKDYCPNSPLLDFSDKSKKMPKKR